MKLITNNATTTTATVEATLRDMVIDVIYDYLKNDKGQDTVIAKKIGIVTNDGDTDFKYKVSTLKENSMYERIAVWTNGSLDFDNRQEKKNKKGEVKDRTAKENGTYEIADIISKKFDNVWLAKSFVFVEMDDKQVKIDFTVCKNEVNIDSTDIIR